MPMSKDIHPTYEMLECREKLVCEEDGKRYVLRFHALDYSTHVGVVVRVALEDGDRLVTEVPFEAHWHQRGRFLLQAGPVKLNEDVVGGDEVAEQVNIHVCRAITDAMAQAKERLETFHALKAGAKGILSEIAARLGAV